MSNYASKESTTDEETNVRLTSTDFVAASALLEDNDDMEEEESCSHFTPVTKKPNLCKLTEGIKNKVCKYDTTPESFLNVISIQWTRT